MSLAIVGLIRFQFFTQYRCWVRASANHEVRKRRGSSARRNQLVLGQLWDLSLCGWNPGVATCLLVNAPFEGGERTGGATQARADVETYAFARLRGHAVRSTRTKYAALLIGSWREGPPAIG